MFNLRQLNKFFISGGWQDITKDPQILKDYGIVAVLDLQFTEIDNLSMAAAIAEELKEVGIEYQMIPFSDMSDYFYNDPTLQQILDLADTILTEWEFKYPKKNQHILIKCAAGVSRSGTAYLYHVCKRDNTTFHEALADARDAEYGVEYGISPNNRFWNFLNKAFPFDYGVNDG